MVTFRDITDSVKVERALIERNEALEAADALKNAFVGHVSYHLRTPLNTLIGYAHMLAEGTAGALNPRQSEFLAHVSQSSDALRALKFAEVVVVLMDATCPFEEQDLRLADLVAREGRAIVLGYNKSDLVTSAAFSRLREEADHWLPQVKGVPIVPCRA